MRLILHGYESPINIITLGTIRLSYIDDRSIHEAIKQYWKPVEKKKR